MVSHCAALVTESEVTAILTIDETLHQLDIRGDGTGWFQSGFLITSLHHWGRCVPSLSALIAANDS
jgi:hypothetical protein